jgi:D,D-heptose 1,7-bisphosphate phosphatase
MSSPAVFLDRDGTLNIDPGYIGDPSNLKLFPGTGEALFKLKSSGFKLLVISNQSGIARGLITEENVRKVNLQLNNILSASNVAIDKFYYCPAHPDFSTEEECECRKPSTKMVYQAANEFSIDLRRSYFVGDSISDIECAHNSGMKSVLVLTGQGSDSLSILQNQNKLPSFVAENIMDACKFILTDSSGVH